VDVAIDIDGRLDLEIMDIQKVMSYLPHRYPFLLVDKVVEFEPSVRLVGIKNVTINEPFFTGHFPVKAVMPGVLIIEAMAQATGLLAMASNPDTMTRDNALYYLVGVDNARFKRQVIPGDQIRLEARLNKIKRGIWFFSAEATVESELAASADIMCISREV